MKIAFGSTSAVNMLEAHLGTASYTTLWQGGTKIWPSARVAKISFRASEMDGFSYSYFVGSKTWGYYVHVDHVLGEQPASDIRNLQLSVGGLTYMLKKTFGGVPLGSVSVDKSGDALVVSFAKGVGPVADAVSVGKVATLKMVGTAHSMGGGFTVTSSTYSKTYTLPWLPGTTATVSRTTNANQTLMFTVSDRGNHIFVGINGNTGGKSASVTIKASASGQHPDVVWLGGTDDFTAAYGESMKVTFSPLTNVVTAASVLFSVPAFTKTSKLTILSITKE